MARLATRSNPALPASLVDEIARRRPALARHMVRAVLTLVRWDDSAGAVPHREAIERACEAGIDLFLAPAREAPPATEEELRGAAPLGLLPARTPQAVGPGPAPPRNAPPGPGGAAPRAPPHPPPPRPGA